jgi:hypothetical protein
MDITLLQTYMAFKAPSPRNMLFLFDPSGIVSSLEHLAILERNFDVIHYESDLQVRNLLEKHKDDTQGKRFCIISSKSDDENLLISDYIARSSHITVNPQTLLEFLQKGYRWSEEVNQLRGSDFWENIERLQKYREALPGNLTSVECNNVILSAMLNVDLSRALLPSEAIGLQRRLDSDEKIAQMRGKYPNLVDALERLVREAIPLMAKIGQDKDLARFLWVSYSLATTTMSYSCHVFWVARSGRNTVKSRWIRRRRSASS